VNAGLGFVLLVYGEGIVGAFEAPRIARAVLEGFELGLAEGVVVAHPRTRVATPDAVVVEELTVDRCNHGRAAVLVDDKLAWFDRVAFKRVAE